MSLFWHKYGSNFKVFGKEADFNLLFFILPKTVYILNV